MLNLRVITWAVVLIYPCPWVAVTIYWPEVLLDPGWLTAGVFATMATWVVVIPYNLAYAEVQRLRMLDKREARG